MPAASRTRRQEFYRRHFLVAFAIVLGITLILWFLLSGVNQWYTWLGCWLVAANVTSFGYYGYDKGQARSEKKRIPEALLHTLTAIGGSLGSYAGMQFFRHKTIKGKFQILFWCIVVLQVSIALWVIKSVWWS